MKTITDKEWHEILGASTYSESRQDYEERMHKEGYTSRRPDGEELFIDIDTEEQEKNFYIMFNRLKEEFPEAHISFNKPSSGGHPHRHIIVQMPFSMNDFQRIAFQACLQSDPIKELLSMFRSYAGDPCPVLFMEKAEIPDDPVFDWEEDWD